MSNPTAEPAYVKPICEMKRIPATVLYVFIGSFDSCAETYWPVSFNLLFILRFASWALGFVGLHHFVVCCFRYREFAELLEDLGLMGSISRMHVLLVWAPKTFLPGYSISQKNRTSRLNRI